MPWGYHYHYDVAGCSNVSDKEHVTGFIKELVTSIDMTPLGEPFVEHINVEGVDSGITAVQVITTSSITAHFIDDTGDLYLDVFSCKEFDVNNVKAVVDKFFKPKLCAESFMTRQAPR
jgi:S-adenosylmethionine/arginine decarboxylase-like enzyme